MVLGASARVLVVGGGIAGLASAWHLARRGARVTVLEREALLASHATGRNAAIFRQLEHDEAGAALAVRSSAQLAELAGDGPALLRRCGAVYLGTARELDPLAALGARVGVATQRLAGTALAAHAAWLEGGDAPEGLLVASDGVLDAHALVSALVAQARAAGATVRCGAGVARVLQRGEAVHGVSLDDGEVLAADRVVLGVGAWTTQLAEASGLVLPIEPRRRHLAMLALPEGAASERAGPVLWRLDDAVYLRPEAGGALASPCDEEPWAPGIPPTDRAVLERLATRLARVAPSLATSAVRTTWACLRSFAPDGRLLAGEDDAARGLVWVAGLGGRGMSVGLGLGEAAAAAALGQEHRWREALRPSRVRGATTP